MIVGRGFRRAWRPLLELQTLWELEYPNRERGGRAAIAGFRFQFHVYLLETVRTWLGAKREQRDTPLVLMEFLSDVVQAYPAEGVIVTQVKLRESSSHVHHALREFWALDQLAGARVPDLAGNLRYRILSAEPELKNVRASIDRWEPAEEDHTNWAEDLANFKGRVGTEVFCDPHAELVAVLTNQLRAPDPLMLVAKWTDELLLAASGSQDMELAARRIRNDLDALELEGGPKAPHGVYLWREADRAPRRVRPGGVLTGERPRPRNLLDGFFWAREAVFSQVLASALQWIDRQRRQPDSSQRPAVFWIGGPVGEAARASHFSICWPRCMKGGFGP